MIIHDYKKKKNTSKVLPCLIAVGGGASGFAVQEDKMHVENEKSELFRTNITMSDLIPTSSDKGLFIFPEFFPIFRLFFRLEFFVFFQNFLFFSRIFSRIFPPQFFPIFSSRFSSHVFKISILRLSDQTLFPKKLFLFPKPSRPHVVIKINNFPKREI